MPRSSPRDAKDEHSGSHLFENVVNPFCGTLADDLDVERTPSGLKVVKNGCSQSIAGFERKLPPANPSVKGKDVALSKAVEEAATVGSGTHEKTVHRRNDPQARQVAGKGAGTLLADAINDDVSGTDGALPRGRARPGRTQGAFPGRC